MKQRRLRILDTLVDGPTNDLREIMFVLEQFEVFRCMRWIWMSENCYSKLKSVSNSRICDSQIWEAGRKFTGCFTDITKSAYDWSGMHYFLIISGWYQTLVALQALVK